MRSLLPLLLLFACSAPPEGSAFDRAEAIAHQADQKRVRELYGEAAKSDPDPLRREQATLRAAYLEWRVFRNGAAARALLGTLDSSQGHLERTRFELEFAKDLPAARAAAARALATARTNEERQKATLASARLAMEGKRYADAIAAIESTIDAAGPRIEIARLLLQAAIHAGDDATALRAFRWYYADVPQLVPATIPNRQALGRALANARLYKEAAMLLDDPQIDAYAATLERIEALVDEHYRNVALGKENQRAFRKAVQNALPKDAQQRFGAVTIFGETDDIPGMHFGHRVLDERRAVEQYGRRGMLRFVLLDNMLANGFAAWILDGRSGTGGWNENETVYQVRPMYANGPLNAWQSIADPERRAKRDREIADETRRDAERVRAAPITALRGLELRLERQYLDSLRASLAAQGLRDDALRAAFVRRYRAEEFEYSIWAHEGRHVIDRTQLNIDESEELEYGAKLSQIAFSSAPRAAVGAILAPIGGGTAHGEANRRVLEGLLRVLKVKLVELDRVSDEELRRAARALDPLAR